MLSKALLALSLVLLTAPAWAMEHYINVLQDRHGEALGGVTVTVYLSGTLTKAAIFSDNGANQKSNPFTSDANGDYDFYAANGVYDFSFVRSGYTFPIAYTRIALFDVNDGGGGGGGSTTFTGILSGTNNGAAMVVSSGASLNFTGSGSINASLFRGQTTIGVASGGTNVTTSPDDTVMVGNGTTWQTKTLPSCANALTSKVLYDPTTNTFTCGADQTGSSTFDTLGSGTNISSTMVVGTGGSLTFSGTGNLNASAYHGNAVIAVADGGTGLSSAIDDAVLVGTAGGAYARATLPGCNNPTTSKLLYDAGANAFSCGTDQSAGGGVTFDTIGTGSNTTATMTLGTGSTLTLAGTGSNISNINWPNSTTINAGNSPLTGLTTHSLLFCDTTAAARVFNLPAATVKVRYTVYNLGSNTCTINRAGADTITTGVTSGTSFIIRNAGSNFWLQPDGASVWYVGG